MRVEPSGHDLAQSGCARQKGERALSFAPLAAAAGSRERVSSRQERAILIFKLVERVAGAKV